MEYLPAFGSFIFIYGVNVGKYSSTTEHMGLSDVDEFPTLVASNPHFSVAPSGNLTSLWNMFIFDGQIHYRW